MQGKVETEDETDWGKQQETKDWIRSEAKKMEFKNACEKSEEKVAKMEERCNKATL